MKEFWLILRIVIGFLGALCLIGYVIYALFGRVGLLNYETILTVMLIGALTGSGPE